MIDGTQFSAAFNNTSSECHEPGRDNSDPVPGAFVHVLFLGNERLNARPALSNRGQNILIAANRPSLGRISREVRQYGELRPRTRSVAAAVPDCQLCGV